MKIALYWIAPCVFSIFVLLFPDQPPESPTAGSPSSNSAENSSPTPPPTAIDKNDPLFQELLKQIEKNGPSLKDSPISSQLPGGNFSDLKNEETRILDQPSEPSLNSGEEGSEKRWMVVENLLRKARELKRDAVTLRAEGLTAQSDRLNNIAQELRQLAVESAPVP